MPATALASPPPTPRSEVRDAVWNLLGRSAAFAQLSPAQQQQVARNTAQVADYLLASAGTDARQIPDILGRSPAAKAPVGRSSEAGCTTARSARPEIGEVDFEDQAAHEANTAGLLLKQIEFPTFVASLIEGVFQVIVNSSIEQMKAYSELIKAAAKSLEQFQHDSVGDKQAHHHIADLFPDLFEISADGLGIYLRLRLTLRDGAD